MELILTSTFMGIGCSAAVCAASCTVLAAFCVLGICVSSFLIIFVV
jgi:hypothetical protein